MLPCADVAGGEDTGDAGHQGAIGDDEAAVVGFEEIADDLAVRRETDEDEDAGGVDFVRLAGFDVFQDDRFEFVLAAELGRR